MSRKRKCLDTDAFPDLSDPAAFASLRGSCDVRAVALHCKGFAVEKDSSSSAGDLRTLAQLAELAQLSPADKKELDTFIALLTEDFDTQCGPDVSKALLPLDDEKLLVRLFEYSMNNVGNPDGGMRYGFSTRKFGHDMINDDLAYLHMKPYGLASSTGEKADPTASFGYITLGEQEAFLWAARACTQMFQKQVGPRLVKNDIAIVTVGKHSNQVYAAAFQQDMKVVEHPSGSLSKTFANTCGNHGSKAFLVALYIDETTDVKEVANMIREAREALDSDDKPYPVFFHVQSSTLAEVRRFSQDYNVLLKDTVKFFAFPAVPESKGYGTSGNFYIDSVSISKVRTVKDSLCLNIGRLLTTVENKKFFNDVNVAYIDTCDSTVVGSSNGIFLMFDWYVRNRFPSLHRLKEANTSEDLAASLNAHTFYESGTLEKLFGYMGEITDRAIGYPLNTNFDHSDLNGLFSLLIRQRVLTLTESKLSREVVVDMKEAKTKKGTPYIERFTDDVVDFFKNEVWFKKDADRWDGFVTTGGTEGNYVGLFLASQHFGPGKAKLFMTGESHYCVPKGAALFGLPVVQVETRTEQSGEMDAEDLLFKVRAEREVNPDLKVVVCLNTSSTMKASLDHALSASSALHEAGVSEEDRWLHVDGAFQSCVYAFLDDAEEIMPFMKAPTEDGYVRIHSIATSVHKQLGSCIPAGVCMFDKKRARAVKAAVRGTLQDMIPRETQAEVASYLSTFGTVMTGTDNGVLAAIVWSRVKQLGYSGLQAFAKHCMAVSKYAFDKLEANVSKTGVKPYRNKHANIITMRPPPSWWVLNMYGLPSAAGESHIVMCAHVGTDVIDDLIKDMIVHPFDDAPLN